ncbi:hypothetical protein SVIOM342S_04458 [Streptomyces violaceorubidus]
MPWTKPALSLGITGTNALVTVPGGADGGEGFSTASFRNHDGQRVRGQRGQGHRALDRGWLLGHFKEASDPRHSEDVEIKWGVHPKGDERAHWVTGEDRTALQVLISGRFRVEYPAAVSSSPSRATTSCGAGAWTTPGTRRRSPWS